MAVLKASASVPLAWPGLADAASSASQGVCDQGPSVPEPSAELRCQPCGAWDFPLSRSEKVRRLLLVFDTEVSSSECENARLRAENAELRRQLASAEQAPGVASAARNTIVESKADSRRASSSCGFEFEPVSEPASPRAPLLRPRPSQLLSPSEPQRLPLRAFAADDGAQAPSERSAATGDGGGGTGGSPACAASLASSQGDSEALKAPPPSPTAYREALGLDYVVFGKNPRERERSSSQRRNRLDHRRWRWSCAVGTSQGRGTGRATTRSPSRGALIPLRQASGGPVPALTPVLASRGPRGLRTAQERQLLSTVSSRHLIQQ